MLLYIVEKNKTENYHFPFCQSIKMGNKISCGNTFCSGDEEDVTSLTSSSSSCPVATKAMTVETSSVSLINHPLNSFLPSYETFTQGSVCIRRHKYHKLPRWCKPFPIVTPEIGQLIRVSWDQLTDKNRNLKYLQLDTLNNNQSEILFSPRENQVTSNNQSNATKHVRNRSTSSDHGLTSNNNDNNNNNNNDNNNNKSIYHNNSIGIGTSGSGTDTSSNSNCSIAYQKSNLVIVFDLLLKNWTAIDPSVCRIWRNTKDAVSIIARMIKFFVTNCTKMDEPELQSKIKTISIVHMKHGVSNFSFGALAEALMITMKSILSSKE